MAELQWNLITDGATFEALVTALIFFEDPKARLFGRRGRDGGQDALSGDRTIVYQAKHHVRPTLAKAIADAKKEAETIGKYRSPGHPNCGQWNGVARWRLVTNAEFNPRDEEAWRQSIAPLFAAQGLVAECWHRRDLNSRLYRHPELIGAFFRNEPRALLSLPEVRASLPLQEAFLERATLRPFVGREREVRDVLSFLSSDKFFLVVHGAGGVGKTRLLLEAGEKAATDGAWQVTWANTATMAVSSSWFGALVPERPTLLLLDDPDSEQILRVLAEQLGNRLSQWKILVAVRSPNDPVLRFLFGPRVRNQVQELAVGGLPKEAAEAMCSDLLASGALSSTTESKRRDAAKELAQRFEAHPIWLTLAVRVLETSGNLSGVPTEAEGLADLYVGEIVDCQEAVPRDKLLALLRWIALIGTLDRNDSTTLSILVNETGLGNATAVREAIASLVERRALMQRGARGRLVEVKPDVIRDRLLLKWLAVDVGSDHSLELSSDAERIQADLLSAASGEGIDAPKKSILLSLARTELLLELAGRPLSLLDLFFAGLQNALPSMSATQRVAVPGALAEVAFFHPENCVALSRAMRDSNVATESIDGIFRTREAGQDDVVQELAWTVFHAGMGARSETQCTQVLGELCALAEAEAAIAARGNGYLQNDGKRATSLIRRTIDGGPDFWSSYDIAARAIAGQFLDEVAERAPTAARSESLKALLEASTSVDRRPTWSDEHSFHLQYQTLFPDHPGWKTRNRLLDRVKEILADDDTPPRTRVLLWNVLANAHRSANQGRLHAGGSEQAWNEFYASVDRALLDDLRWARSALQGRTDIEELKSARRLWEWHLRFEEKDEPKEASEQLEAIYAGNELAGEFSSLLGQDDFDQRPSRAKRKAEELADSQAGAIDAFLTRAAQFLGGEQELHQVSNVAWCLGLRAEESPSVQTFVGAQLAQAGLSCRTSFATIVANSWVTCLRRTGSATAACDRVLKLLGGCGSDARKIALVQEIYGRLPMPGAGDEFTNDEYELVRSQAELFTTNRISALVGHVFCTPDASRNERMPTQLVSHFIQRNNTKKKTAAAVFESIRLSFGWPVGISYAVRNHFVHDGAQLAGSDFFAGPTKDSAFRVSADAWNRIEDTAHEAHEVNSSFRRAGATWPATPTDDLRVTLVACEREMDDALGILVGTACASLGTHVGFMLGED